MPAPAVQSLNDLISTLSQGTKEQQAQLDSSLATNEQSGTAQVAGLEAAKNNAFGQIDQSAQNKGMIFSGFSPDQEAKYTAATYLPALAQVQKAIADARGQILSKKADINASVYNQAFGVNQDQQKELNTYNNQQDQNAFTASQADATRKQQLEMAQFQADQDQKQRDFQAAQDQITRLFQAGENDKARAAQASLAAAKQSNDQQAYNTLVSQATNTVKQFTGDKYIDRNEYEQTLKAVQGIVGNNASAEEVLNTALNNGGYQTYKLVNGQPVVGQGF